jgi:hypothetical protein
MLATAFASIGGYGGVTGSDSVGNVGAAEAVLAINGVEVI